MKAILIAMLLFSAFLVGAIFTLASHLVSMMNHREFEEIDYEDERD